MKRLILVIFLSTVGIVCKGQYAHYYNPMFVLVDLETTQLNNIRFDTNALKENPEAWESYKTFHRIDSELAKKRKKWTAIAWTGVGIEFLAYIPLYQYLTSDEEFKPNPNYSKENRQLGWTIGLGAAGLITCVTGCIKASSCNKKMKENKKDFIYYLKTSHNGIGIVAIF